MPAQALRRNILRPFTPQQIPGLLAEYRCDDGAGTTLRDYSGNNYHATLGLSGSFVPSWGSGGVVCGGSHMLELPTSFWSKARTIQLFANCAGNNDFQTLIAGDFDWFALREGSGSPFWLGQDIVPSTASAEPMRGPNHVGVVAAPSGKQRLYQGREEVRGYSAQATSYTPGSPGAVWMGDTSGTGLWFTGTFYYLLAYDRTLSPAQIQTNYDYVERVLSRRGVTLGDTYLTRSLVVYAGDSLTAGASAGGYANEYPTKVHAALSNGYPWSNNGVSGQQLDTLLARQAANFDTLPAKYTGAQKVFVLWSGTNDIVAGRSAAQIRTDLNASAAQALAAGYTKVVIVSPLPRTDGNETVRQALLTGLLSDYATNVSTNLNRNAGSTIYLADIGNDATLGGATAFNDATKYAGDKIHLIAAGYTIVATLVQAALVECGLS